MLVGGGGAGARSFGDSDTGKGGGGAGELLYKADYILEPNKEYAIGIGAGGVGKASGASETGANGGDTTGFGVVARGGGGGGKTDSGGAGPIGNKGANGGSGGGGGSRSSGGQFTGGDSVASGQGGFTAFGNKGGDAANCNCGGGGGGGAGGQGHNYSGGHLDSRGGAGGPGKDMGDVVGTDIGEASQEILQNTFFRSNVRCIAQLKGMDPHSCASALCAIFTWTQAVPLQGRVARRVPPAPGRARGRARQAALAHEGEARARVPAHRAARGGPAHARRAHAARGAARVGRRRGALPAPHGPAREGAPARQKRFRRSIVTRIGAESGGAQTPHRDPRLPRIRSQRLCSWRFLRVGHRVSSFLRELSFSAIL